jgi:hypothetical protein
MDAQFWIYIVIGVIYFLSRLLKKPEQAPGEGPDSQQPQRGRQAQAGQGTEKPRQMTFEELLREITEGKQAQPQAPRPRPRQEPQYETLEKDLGDEARSLERVDFDEAENARVFQKYEEAKSLALERRSLEETLKLEDTVVDFKRFEAFEKKKRRNVLQDYIKIIRNPESLKHAVVMSEILKRKF